MRNFLTSLICILILSSCTNPITKGLNRVDSPANEYVNLYFSDLQTDYVYKAKIKAFDSNFGGILIIKKINDQHHRIVFTTEFGNKIFDFEIEKGAFKTHFILDALDRAIIINTLKRDFETLTNENNVVLYQFESDHKNVFQSKIKKRYNHYFVNTETHTLEQILQSNKTKLKTIFSFNNVEKSIARRIKIEHKSVPLTINLEYLNNH